MWNLGFFLGTSLALGMILAASSAKADIPPPGSCEQYMLGKSCMFPVDKDGKDFSGPGICVAEMCTRATPDGPMQYECNMCRPANVDPVGTAGAGGEGGAEPVGATGGTGGDAGKPPTPVAGSTTGGTGTAGTAGKGSGAVTNNNADSDADGGCSVAPGARGTAVSLAGLGLALGLMLRRRRSSNLVRG
jgi:hypothetical protein